MNPTFPVPPTHENTRHQARDSLLASCPSRRSWQAEHPDEKLLSLLVVAAVIRGRVRVGVRIRVGVGVGMFVAVVVIVVVVVVVVFFFCVFFFSSPSSCTIYLLVY